MPTIPLRKHLLRGAFAYAKWLQEFRRRVMRRRDSFTSDPEEESDAEFRNTLNAIQQLDSDSSDSDDISSLSSLSSLSSISSLASSDSEGRAENDPGPHLNHLNFPHNDDSLNTEDDEDALHMKQLAAIKKRIHYLETTRVLRPNKVHKLSQLCLVLISYKKDDPKRFRRNLRILPETFDALLAKVEWLPIFLSDGPHDQMPVAEQLAITLFRFGHFGNSASVESVAQWAGCSAGMVVNATRRVMEAFLSFHDEVIHYPSAADKEAAKEWVEAASCAAWRDGWIFVDGTLIPLADKPGFHGEAYFDRKSNYSFNVQVRLIYFYLNNNLNSFS